MKTTIPQKTTIRLVAALFSIFLLLSCEEYIEVEMPPSELTGTAVYQDESTAKAALANIYAKMRDGGVASGAPADGTSLFANYADDLDFYGSNFVTEQFNKHTLRPSNSNLLRLWNKTYNEIYSINALIEGVLESTALTDDTKAQLLGEAHFLRAFNYFNLVSIFGDIPYTTSTNYQANAVLARTQTSVVWQHIIEDLIISESQISAAYPSEQRVRVNKSAVQALLARVYLYTGDFVQAENYASAVINDPKYSIEPNLDAAFLADSPSIIWSFHPGIAGQNTLDATTFNFSSGPPSKPSLSADLYNSFENDDLRKTFWIKQITNANTTWYRPFKYKETSATGSSREFTIILRIEEQFLIRSEARCANGDLEGAKADLNKIRDRAGLPETAAQTIYELKIAILKERRFEFFTEQTHRWFDLKRTGNAASVLEIVKPQWQDRDILLPIPEAELLLNDNLLPQNQGY